MIPQSCLTWMTNPMLCSSFATTPTEVGGVYSMRIRLRNVTAVLQPLRVFPPASQYFHISLPRFPGVEGLVAPGMAAELTLRFCPDSLADYDDSFTLDTAGSRVSIPMLGRRPPPSLSLPQVRIPDDAMITCKGASGEGSGCLEMFIQWCRRACVLCIPVSDKNKRRPSDYMHPLRSVRPFVRQK